MGNRALRRGVFVAGALVLACSNIRASLIYTYDFPGPGPNNGAAANQTNPQPSHATLSDFTRNGGLIGTGVADVFGSTNWPTGSPNLSVFTAFTVTASPGFVLDLTQLTFQSLKNGVGPANAAVALYLNGSATVYASFAWTPTNAPLTNYTFNFTPLTPANNVTTATFKFYAWNATDNTNEVQFDNVAIFGAIDVPEAAGLGPAALVILSAISLHQFRLGQRRNRSGLGL